MRELACRNTYFNSRQHAVIHVRHVSRFVFQHMANWQSRLLVTFLFVIFAHVTSDFGVPQYPTFGNPSTCLVQVCLLLTNRIMGSVLCCVSLA